MKKDNLKQQYRINEQIRVREVRIVGDDVESTVMPTAKALQMAEAQGVDLVEISPNAVPPVCRLIDYSKFLYQQKKRQKEMKAKQVKVDVKEIRFGPQTRAHGRTYQDSRGSSVDGIGRGRSGGLYRVRTEPYYGPADGGPGVLSGGGALHGEEYRPYRDGCLERVGEYAAGIVCRHRAQRYLPDGWRSFVAWFGQTVDRQDQHSVPHRRRSATQCGQRHRYSIEEREQLFFFDVTRAGLIRFSEEI